VLGNFILPHWKSLWIPFFQVSNFILQSTFKRKEKDLQIILADAFAKRKPRCVKQRGAIRNDL